MENAYIIQILLIIWGIVSIILSFKSFAWNRMIITIEFWWCILTIMIMVLACFHRLFLWCNNLPLALVLLLAATAIITFHTLFHLCKTVSMLVNRNQEMCMQVSLLNQENEQILILNRMNDKNSEIK